MEAKLMARLNDARGKVRINGFRPGRVPIPHLRKVYGKSFMAEVVNDILTNQTRHIIADRGEKAAMFIFDEELGLLFERAKGLGIDIQAMVDSDKLTIEQVDAAELTPGELSARVRRCVEELRAQTVVIDSLNGYQAAMPEEKQLILHMHELLQFLNRQGANTFLTVAQHGLVGDMRAPVDVTYLADTVILLRYFEAMGRVRRAISVIKKRTSAHEDTIREYRIGSHGIRLGPPLTNFQGVLRGVPEMVGVEEALMEPETA